MLQAKQLRHAGCSKPAECPANQCCGVAPVPQNCPVARWQQGCCAVMTQQQDRAIPVQKPSAAWPVHLTAVPHSTATWLPWLPCSMPAWHHSHLDSACTDVAAYQLVLNQASPSMLGSTATLRGLMQHAKQAAAPDPLLSSWPTYVLCDAGSPNLLQNRQGLATKLGGTATFSEVMGMPKWQPHLVPCFTH